MRVTTLDVSVYTIPTDQPEADGTIDWDSTTMVLVELTAENGERGLGYTYASTGAATVIHDTLMPLVVGYDVESIGTIWTAMVRAVRNMGRSGIAACAISAIDSALWDLKARIAGQPLYRLLGEYRERVPIYGSGGFTTYTDERLTEQISGWVAQGISRVKIKIGRAGADGDVARVRVARQAIGDDAELFVDANGAYNARQAVTMANHFAEYGVSYFEEPVSSDQLAQIVFVRQHASMAIAAGEYGYDLWYFREMLMAGAVDILQADATRCLGITGWLQAGTLAYAFATPFSGHTAPALHTHIACCVPQIDHLEYFYDHVRIEGMFFDGIAPPQDGYLAPDPTQAGLGLTFKRQDAERWRV